MRNYRIGCMNLIWKITRRLTYMCGKIHVQCYNFIPGVRVKWGTLIELGVVLSPQCGGTIQIGSDCYLYRGANSVVTKSTEEFGIYVGIPAKLKKHR